MYVFGTVARQSTAYGPNSQNLVNVVKGNNLPSGLPVWEGGVLELNYALLSHRKRNIALYCDLTQKVECTGQQ